MRTRKTVNVEWLRDRVNHMLAVSTCSPDERRAMAGVLESVLHETGNYRGFQYLEVTRDSETSEAISFGDESRVRYF